MTRTLSFVAAALLVAQAAIHVHQYVADGFSQIPVIGVLFLVHAVLAVVIAGAVAIRGGWISASAGIALSVGALLGLVLAKTMGLFGFSAGPWRTMEIAAAVVEVLTVLALVPAAEAELRRHAEAT